MGSKKYEFQRKLKRKCTGDKCRNWPIKLPNGAVFSIQGAKDAASYPRMDFDDPTDYEEYEVAISFEDRWITPTHYHTYFNNSRGEQVPAAVVEEMYQLIKSRTSDELKKMPYTQKSAGQVSRVIQAFLNKEHSYA